ncbi:LD-carboxypeptidase [Streptomyces sp. ODS28]|uniref:S66 peptidase family protein n=1 Tax=Streptomyces sp. ODS28 TaxID=3136688 RepID=UPI0031EDF0BF
MTLARGPLARPRRLVPGDRVAVVAPSGSLPRERLERGVRVLRDWGLEPVVMPHVLDAHPEFENIAGRDEDRARDFQDAWCEDGFAGVFAARGGYGTQRMVDLLDWEALRAARPKVFVGYSDLTVLHEALAERLGLGSVHAPMIATESFLSDKGTQEGVRRALFEPEAEAARVLTTGEHGAALAPGRARGIVLGGNLSLLATERGTAHARASAAGGILVLEDVAQPPYSIDRLLTQLLRTGWFEGVAGIALGSWTDCGEQEEVRAVLRDRLAGLGVPVVAGFEFGHDPTSLTLPLGAPAVLDAASGTLTYEEAALA